MLCCCLSEGKPIPTELRKDEAELRKAIEFDDEKHERKCGYLFNFYLINFTSFWLGNHNRVGQLLWSCKKPLPL